MTVPNLTSQHIAFNEWLKQCPLGWFQHLNLDPESYFDSVVYEFTFSQIKDKDKEVAMQAFNSYLFCKGNK